MNKTYLIAIAAALMAAPLVMAHEPAGTPKNYCEPQAEWNTHDYGPVSSGRLIYGNEDGNLGGDCDGSDVDGILASDPGVICLGVNPADPINSFFVGLCDAQINLPAADWDEHNEFAFGGAWILSENGPGAADPNGGGTTNCFGAEAHHGYYGPVTVHDPVLGAGVEFRVAADLVDANPATPSPCGDFISDTSTICIYTCSVTFPPGIDGAYVVFVTGSAGHIAW